MIFCIEFDFNSFDPRDIALEVSEHECHTMYNLNPTGNRFETVSDNQCYPPDIQKVMNVLLFFLTKIDIISTGGWTNGPHKQSKYNIYLSHFK